MQFQCLIDRFIGIGCSRRPAVRNLSAGLLVTILSAAAWPCRAADAPRWPEEATASFPAITGHSPFFLLNPNRTVASFDEAESVPIGDGTPMPNNQNEHPPHYFVPKPVRGLSGVVGLSASDMHAVALLADGTVKAWGRHCPALGREVPPEIVNSPQTVDGMARVVKVIAGDDFTAVVSPSGQVAVWGDSSNGRMGIGQYREIWKAGQGVCSRPKLLPLRGVTQLVGENHQHMLALLQDGRVAAFGDNRETGVLGDGTELERLSPVLVSNLSDIVEVATGGTRSYALGRDGRVWQWGKELSPTPVQVKGLGKAVAIWAAGAYAFARLEDGSFWGWGEGYGGVLCSGKFDKVYEKPIKTLLTGPIAAMYATQRGVFAWRPDGTLIGCGQHGFNVPNAPRKGHSMVPEPLLKWTAPDHYEFAVRTSTAPAPRR